jgi:hypothetical protein
MKQPSVETKITSSFTKKDGETLDLLNIDITPDGQLTKRRGWRSFWGMVWELYKVNQKYRKFGLVGNFNIMLPLPISKKPKGLTALFSTQQAQMREEHEEEMECLALNLKENHRISLAQMREKIKGLHISGPQHSCPNEEICAECIYEEAWNDAIENVLALFDKGEE